MLAAYKDSKKLNFLLLQRYTHLTKVFPKSVAKEEYILYM